jgi:transposase
VVRREVLVVPAVYAMSDALWARIAPVVARADPLPPPDARTLLDAIIYRALTGGTWDDLPSGYPPPANVAACAAQWRQQGVLERIEVLLLILLGS